MRAGNGLVISANGARDGILEEKTGGEMPKRIGRPLTRKGRMFQFCRKYLRWLVGKTKWFKDWNYKYEWRLNNRERIRGYHHNKKK